MMYFIKLPPSPSIPQVMSNNCLVRFGGGVVLIKCIEQRKPQSLIGRTRASCGKYLCTDTHDLKTAVRY